MKWSGSNKVEVVVPQSMKDSVCGLCGDYDGNKTNDWQLGKECPGKIAGTVVSECRTKHT